MQPYIPRINGTLAAVATSAIALLTPSASPHAVAKPETLLPSEASGMEPRPDAARPGNLRDMCISQDLNCLLGIAERAGPEPGFAAIGLPLQSRRREWPDAEYLLPRRLDDTAKEVVMKIANRRQALMALRSFENELDTRLPQWNGTAPDLQELSAGTVRFHGLPDLLATFPCAASTERSSRRSETRALLNGREVMMARDEQSIRRIRYGSDGQHWERANVYTDRAVEVAKLAMWQRIFSAARRRSLAA